MPVKDNLPKGFRLAVALADVKGTGKKKSDMMLAASERLCTAAGTFTTNKVKAAPVMLDMVRVRYGRAQAVVLNSGNANACTGERGMADAREMAELTAKGLGIDEKYALVCSTGVIGVPMPMPRVRKAIPELVAGLGSATLEDAARAIMTTDTYPKFVTRKVKVGSYEGTIAAIAKGAGMIAPNMATMLSVIMTDVAIEAQALKLALSGAVEQSFNRITIDGDRSTNDTAIVLANGLADNAELTRLNNSYPAFCDALTEVCYGLSHDIVRDGEGATKVIEVIVNGARSETHARRAAMGVANSLLVKTAVYGADPNWGRILAAVGSADVMMSEERTEISIGRAKIFAKGKPTGKLDAAKQALSEKEVTITVNLGMGTGSCKVLTCDLTEDYIKINAEYTT